MQRIQTLLPQRSITAEPRIDLSQRLGADAVDAPLRLVANVDQPRLAKHAKVSRNPWTSNGQESGQVAHGGRTVSQRL